jgi:hypothetical protein
MGKDKLLLIRLEDHEKQLIRRLARDNGLTITEYVLARCKGEIIRNKTDYNKYKAAIHLLTQELNAIGNNINQAVHAMHINNKLDISNKAELIKFNALHEQYHHLLNELRGLLKNAVGY